MLFVSGCSQKAPENEPQKIENEGENLTKEAENVPQDISNVIEKNDRNIVQTLADKNFVTLVDLLNVSGLEQTLAEDGMYTVFAPTDKAFAELPDDVVPALKNNTQELKKVLTYHVSGKVLMKKDLEKMTAIKTLEGGELTVNVTANGIQVGGANITEADILTNNGVIHQIDKVLIPPQ